MALAASSTKRNNVLQISLKFSIRRPWTPIETLHVSHRRTRSDECKFVVALARGLDLLRAYGLGETLLGNRDFVERTGLPKATVNRLAYTLTTLGYLRFDDDAGKYALDTGVLSLGFALLAGADTLELVRPHVCALAREIGAAVSLGCRDGLDMIYLETIRSETALSASCPVRVCRC